MRLVASCCGRLYSDYSITALNGGHHTLGDTDVVFKNFYARWIPAF
jgi:hypothetical protein